MTCNWKSSDCNLKANSSLNLAIYNLFYSAFSCCWNYSNKTKTSLWLSGQVFARSSLKLIPFYFTAVESKLKPGLKINYEIFLSMPAEWPRNFPDFLSNDPVAIMQVRLNWKINYSGLLACLAVCASLLAPFGKAQTNTLPHTHTHMYACVCTTCVWFVEWLPRSLVCQNDKGIDIVVYDKHHHSHRCIYFYFPFPPVLLLFLSLSLLLLLSLAL